MSILRPSHPSVPLAFCLFLCAALLLAACQDEPAVTPPAQDGYSLYFTQPLPPGSRDYHGGPDEALAEAIRAARAGVDLAVYSFDLWSLRDALLDAQRRGVTVRMVVESDNLDSEEIQALKEAGIPVLGDRREGLMHNKFVIIDRQEVWSGSTNFTVNGVYHSNNNLIRLHSPALAQDYLAEFEEMFVEDRFGPGSPAGTPDLQVDVDGSPVEVFFSPDDGTAERLVALIDGGRSSIEFMMNTFTSDELAEAIIRREQAGIAVRGVMDDTLAHSNQGSDYERLRKAGIDVRLDGSPDSMHHKVLVIDGQVVVTGSYNFSASAEERNDENTLILHNPQIAAGYLVEFERLFQQAAP